MVSKVYACENLKSHWRRSVLDETQDERNHNCVHDPPKTQLIDCYRVKEVTKNSVLRYPSFLQELLFFTTTQCCRIFSVSCTDRVRIFLILRKDCFLVYANTDCGALFSLWRRKTAVKFCLIIYSVETNPKLNALNATNTACARRYVSSVVQTKY